MEEGKSGPGGHFGGECSWVGSSRRVGAGSGMLWWWMDGPGWERWASTGAPIWGDGSYQGDSFGRGGEDVSLEFSIRNVELKVSVGWPSEVAAGYLRLELREGVWAGGRDFGSKWTLRRETGREEKVRSSSTWCWAEGTEDEGRVSSQKLAEEGTALPPALEGLLQQHRGHRIP